MTIIEKKENSMQDSFIDDEVLEFMWVTGEEQETTNLESLYNKFGKETVGVVLSAMVEKKLLTIHDSIIHLTETGRKKATPIIRRHRLAERLLNDVLGVSDEVFERGACQFEHFINEDITASICMLLGHPTVCPHGKNIPPGECCSHTKRKLQPVFGPLSRLRTGIKAKIVYLSTGSQESLDWLSSIGVVPGLEFTVHHRKPSLVIRFGETQLALDDEIARYIYVRIITS
ncbi:MAG: metal-dependent transcriptional regulator [Candidatus Scalindua sp.]|jgi:DtxR family Mn-dependent transcriptional regulator|nr:metal-dependent transcriptional regulator [Candidatus Scalindua sp.]MBT5306337.1 metal-dependent transcriptional regulator [Candidatus Scalindua sp.]MBT6047629.1 metal-dependent transcriptional regulator [Candidatus Scalindua sp.]MBT6230659.1 metal-dependent transcriptional regulator [Candidatus Scalindua sp.]MBT6564177.1 metal-dependent transcriptional regulator [Candidatus Scalindua sp.]